MRPSLAWLETFLPSSAQPYRTGLTDPDEGVRREVAWAAAWTRQTWLIEYCRAAASEMFQEDAALFQLLAVLGKPVDLERIVRLARHERLGPARMALLGSFGHPQCVEQLIAAMSSEDVRTAVAAGLAFTKITGVDVDSGEVTTVTASGKDSSGESSLDEELVTLPDAKAAQRYWKQARPRYVDALRWCRGVPLNRQLAAADWNLMDASSGLEICLREHYEGVQRWAPDRIARFPQLRGSTGERPLPSGQ